MNIFNAIKARISILQVINDYTTLKRAGTYWKGSCPFHHERTASFTVTPHKEIFYCFGCHVGGDAIAFIAKAENCSQIEAARYIAENYQLELPEDISWGQTEQQTNERRRYYELCELVATWCAEQLSKHADACSYLKERSLSPASIQKFTIGYFPAGSTALKQLLTVAKKSNFMANDLLQARIVLEGKHGLYAPFEDRIIFPIKEHMGNTCGFGGRVFRPDDARPKYYNSHDHLFFNKGSLLFGFHEAKREIQKQNDVFLVEGYIDCIAMAQAGYPHTVATLGTACSEEHLNVLARYAQSLHILYDGDTAGQKAVLRLSELCWSTNMELFIVSLPEKDDPASYLAKKLSLTDLIAQAKDIFSWYTDHVLQGFANKHLPERIGALQELLTLISKVNDPLKQDLLLQRAASAAAISPKALHEALKKKQGGQQQPTARSSPSQRGSKNNFILEKQIFCDILNIYDYVPEESEPFLVNILPEPCKAIFKQFQDFKRAYPQGEFSTFFSTLTSPEQAIVSKASTASGSEQDMRKRFQKNLWKIIANDVKIKLAQAQQLNDTENVHRIIAEFQSLKQKMLEKGLL